MSSFDERIDRELARWERKVVKPQSITGKFAKGWQNKINQKIPDKVHDTVSSSVKQMIRATLVGSDYLSDQETVFDRSLEEREELIDKKVEMYKRSAAVEGAGTGAGGIFLGLADFPLLLSIKMKFLFDTAKIYGFDVKDYRERLFLLYIFQLAFSKDKQKIKTFEKVKNWERDKEQLPSSVTYMQSVDWKTFQLEYRDFIDLPKTLQLIPGFGAIVGAVANYHYLDVLAYYAKNSFRHRLLKQNNIHE
ncbi:EcsC family protein [Evansella halocellulosilytica]|uniref:EcsC family protein n=1 Tax=Evansella halocellulosilytica TaxID=2011013 RepID=UPI000BB90FD9|nr:EcsC family protein [Evansella halocellulosilytica]